MLKALHLRYLHRSYLCLWSVYYSLQLIMQEYSDQSKLCIPVPLCIVTGESTYIFAWLFFLEIFAYMMFFVSVKSSRNREAQLSCFKSTKVSFTSNKGCSEINEYPRLKDRLCKCRSRCVLRKRCFRNMQQIYKRSSIPKCDFNGLL